MRGVRISSVLRFMRTYTRLTGYPVPAPPGFASAWSRGLNIDDKGSSTLLFTGALYQLVPYINATVRLLSIAEERGLSNILSVLERMAALRPGALQGLVRPERLDLEESEKILRSIVNALRSSGVRFSYDPRVSDMYSGALLLDYGVADELKEHAKRVSEAIEAGGYETVITVDPHTTLTLMSYRQLVGLKVNVVNYLELVRPLKRVRLTATVHDSCIYARDLNLWGKARELLKGSGVSVVEPRNYGPKTFCCGGPVESLSPGLAKAIAKRRVAELREAADVAITMCPICLSNLRRAGGNVIDLSVVIGGDAEGQ
ncbi:MAG: (Fe-S)-binding protein [Acidilobus sp.]